MNFISDFIFGPNPVIKFASYFYSPLPTLLSFSLLSLPLHSHFDFLLFILSHLWQKKTVKCTRWKGLMFTFCSAVG